MDKDKIYIIGAGVSGLVAAIELEKAGKAPIILEASKSVGGRVKTDVIDGVPLDRGFQVLLSAYPAAKEYLDYEALELQRFQAGAVIFEKEKQFEIGDPLRDPGFLTKTILSPAGKLSDKFKIFSLSQKLKHKSIEAIFSEPEMTTMKYLKEYGFSEKIIHRFFRPFFAGIYLEPDLNTSSRMFEFVYKMFAEGYATIPKKGIQAIPEQLSSQLKNTEIRFETPVNSLEDGHIISKNGERLEADRIIVATDPSGIVSGYEERIPWQHSTTIYFKTLRSVLKRPVIGLIPGTASLVNNFHFVTDILPSENKHIVLSATIVREHDLDLEELIRQTAFDLSRYVGLGAPEYIHHVNIPRALPKLNDLKYKPDVEDVRLSDTIYLSGDYLANGSLNAAMLSGKIVAEAVIKSLDL